MTYELVEEPNGRYELLDQPPRKIGVEGLPDAVKAIAGDFNPLTQMAVGGKGLLDMAVYKGKQSLGMKLNPEEEAAGAANRALLQASDPAKAGAVMVGAGTYPLVAPAANFVASRVAPALPSWLGWIPTAATTGAVTNVATTPRLQGDPENTTSKAIEEGAIGGVLGEGVFRGASRLAQPILQTPAVRRLLDKEIVPTVGQGMGGWANRMEEKAMSIPIVGDIINSSRNRARNELGTAAINLEMPAGMKVTKPGNAGVEQADDLLSEGYKKLYGSGTVTRDTQLVSDLRNAVNTPAIPLSNDYKRMYDQIIKRDVLDRLKPNESFTAAEVKTQIEADLGKVIRGLGTKGQEGALRDAVLQARQAVRDLAGRQAGVDQVARKALDTGYANTRAMEGAASRAEGNAGVPTPLQLIREARDGSKLQQLGRDAQEVMGARVPNSGTTDRALMALLIGGAGAGASSTDTYKSVPGLGNLGPGFWLSLGASPLAYSRAGSRYMLGDLPGQGILSSQLRSLAPYGAAAGGILQE